MRGYPADRSSGHLEEAVIQFGPSDLTPTGPPSLHSSVQNPLGFVEPLFIFREFEFPLNLFLKYASQGLKLSIWRKR